jgi:hypothetical protein
LCSGVPPSLSHLPKKDLNKKMKIVCHKQYKREKALEREAIWTCIVLNFPRNAPEFNTLSTRFSKSPEYHPSTRFPGIEQPYFSFGEKQIKVPSGRDNILIFGGFKGFIFGFLELGGEGGQVALTRRH